MQLTLNLRSGQTSRGGSDSEKPEILSKDEIDERDIDLLMGLLDCDDNVVAGWVTQA